MAGHVSDIMTARLVTVRADEPIRAATDLLTRFGFSALPVVNRSFRLVGMVSLLDVLRYREACQSAGRPADETVSVEEIMTSDVVSMQASANLSAVAQRLSSNGQLRVMPIVQGGRLVGVVTRGDLLRRRGDGQGSGAAPGPVTGLRRLLGARRRERAEEDAAAVALFALARPTIVRPDRPLGAATPVHEVMTREAVTVGAGQPVSLAAELLLRHRHTALPVIDGASMLVGIVSEADILGAVSGGPVSIERVMTRTPIAVEAGSTVGQARALVTERGLRTVPVVDDGRLVGVLSRSDLL